MPKPIRNMPKCPVCPANEMNEQVKDSMWFFLMKGGQKVDEETLKNLEEAVDELCRAMMQKTAGQPQYAKKGDIDHHKDIDWIMWRIVFEAAALVLSGRLALKEELENDI